MTSSASPKLYMANGLEWERTSRPSLGPGTTKYPEVFILRIWKCCVSKLAYARYRSGLLLRPIVEKSVPVPYARHQEAAPDHAIA
jgi:hypothetical protein